MKTILITGAAGFIGSFLAKRLLQEEEDIEIVGLDNLNDYYEVSLKEERLRELLPEERFAFVKASIADKEAVREAFAQHRPDIVVNLAAQAGVRYSITNPDSYIESNLIGFYHILEACRHAERETGKKVEHLIYASSSSVYGLNEKVPYSVEDKVDNPVSLYAATKKSNELMAHAYTKLYNIPTTGLRFFTVYGPMGRPDMAYFKFTNKMVKGEKIQIYNYGDMYRDFTYIDDIVEGVVRIINKGMTDNGEALPYRVYNIGNNRPESLKYFVETLERVLMKHGIISHEIEKEYLPMQPGDVYQTYADIASLTRDYGFKPKTGLAEGLDKFAEWYGAYYL